MSGPCWGIFRESAHSPGRESDDAEILRLTSKHLEAHGFDVVLRSPEEIGSIVDPRPRFVFLMCEQIPVLEQLRVWAADGVIAINSPAAVWNTYRERMTGLLEDAGVRFIHSRIVPTAGRHRPGPLPLWVKRADVHQTQEGDVVFVDTEGALDDALARLAARGIPRAVVQPHVVGDLVKFYGIGTGSGPGGAPPWFRWFYHRDQTVAGHGFAPVHLAALAGSAAAALGLEVYGGDAIATPAHGVVLLDLNAWPSFALYREEAASAIASHLVRRFGGGGR